MKNKKIIVIGAGPGGYISAIKAAKIGADVTLVENYRLGGTCLHHGCIPTKTIKASADALSMANRLEQFGIELNGNVQPDIKKIIARKNKVIDSLTSGIEALIKSNRISYINGRATIKAPDLVEVSTAGRGLLHLETDKTIIATGSKPASLPGLTMDGKHVLSSDDVLRIDKIPNNILIVGAGIIGMELAFILKNLGCNVTLIEAMDQILSLPSIDFDSKKLLQRELKKNKIKLLLNQTVESTKILSDGKVEAGIKPFGTGGTGGGEEKKSLIVDTVVVTVGRQYNTKDIGLEQLGMELNRDHSIKVNNRLETSVSNIYAVGDVLGPTRIMLAHVASAEGVIAAENCFGRDHEMNYQVVPNGIFTSPECASVGLSEQQALEKGFQFRSDVFQYRAIGKAQAIGEITGQVKLISQKSNRQILGAHIVGSHATDLIGECTLAMKTKATTKDLAGTIHLHPALSETLKEAADLANDECLHLPAQMQAKSA